MSCDAKQKGLQIELAPQSGFCFGVRRAIELVEAALAEKGPVSSLGQIIHNPQEVERLKEKGLRIVERLEEVEGGAFVIRSHGLAPEVVSAAKEKGLKIIDATCPLVRQAQKIAKTLAQEGYSVFIVGDARHPEVEAICHFVPKATVVTGGVDLPTEAAGGKIGVLAQTTESPERFQEVVQELAGHGFKEIRAFNTICPGTVRREKAAVDVAGRSDIMFVLGGRNSANTNRLARKCKQAGVTTFLLEHFGELVENKGAMEALQGCRQIGITAGASTPDWLIREFIERLRNEVSVAG